MWGGGHVIILILLNFCDAHHLHAVMANFVWWLNSPLCSGETRHWWWLLDGKGLNLFIYYWSLGRSWTCKTKYVNCPITIFMHTLCSGGLITAVIFNPRHAYAARVTVLGLWVCVTFSATTRNVTYKSRYQRVYCYTGFIFLKRQFSYN